MQLLSTAQYVYNNAKNKIMKIMSFFANYEHHFNIKRQSQKHLIKSQQIMINVTKLKWLHKDLSRQLQTQCERLIMIKAFEMKKKMYLQTDNIKTKQKNKKLNYKSIESFRILKNIKDLSYELKLPVKIKIHFVFYAFMFQQCNQDLSIQIIETLIESDDKYEVETILEKKMISREPYYLIKWKEYDVSENIWELKENLKNCARTLWCFEKRWK